MPRREAGPVPQIKGVAMLNAVRALRSLGKARAHELLPPHLHKYLTDERILPVKWYPEEDMLEVNRALAQILRPTLGDISLDDTFVEMGKQVGHIDLSGVYASALRARPPAEMAHRMSMMWEQYHDTGTLDVALEANAGRFELREYGLPSRELCLIQRGWLLAYIELIGATQPNVVEAQCRNRGAASCVWDATWM